MVKDNLKKIRERIFSVCAKIKRNPETITIVAVSKGRTLEQIKEAIAAGLYNIGENRVQEALTKSNEQRAKWHMVGHLQTNKVKEAVKIFDLIHSVDSLRLAEEIDKQAKALDKIQDILIEVKTSPEATKFGFNPDEVSGAVKQISALMNVRVLGLMTIAPAVDNPEEARPYFRQLRELRDSINSLQLETCSLKLLSMGMTDDFEVAIEEGSDMVRLGKAIFEG
ncbi:MAG: YggS family pyridoxal phosphate-dependent enzyme [Candidatus Omnitrophica bacterium]|nr:YggS family pyridoxal phosphate-dependent enzyme [Candidatus Omnitrophota bacterium]